MDTYKNDSDEMKIIKIKDIQKLTVRSKVWIELNGKPFLGEGRYAILTAIDRYGSIIRAAEETNVSYRRIRGVIREMEKAVGQKLVVTSRGGKEGGGAFITQLTSELLACFKKLEIGMNDAVNSKFHRIFK